MVEEVKKQEIKKSKIKIGIYHLLPVDIDQLYGELDRIKRFIEIYYATCKEFMDNSQLIFYVGFKRSQDNILNSKTIEFTRKMLPALFKESYEIARGTSKEYGVRQIIQKNDSIKYDSILIINEDEVVPWAKATNRMIEDFNDCEYFVRAHFDIECNLGLALKGMLWNFEYNETLKKHKIAALSACTQDKLKIGGEQSIVIESEYKGDLFNLSMMIHNNYLGKIKFTGPHKHFFEMIKMEAFNNIGHRFNEDYQAFGDDIEWSVRAFEHGYGLAVCMDTFVFHEDQNFNPFDLEKANDLRYRNKIKLANYKTDIDYKNRYVFLYILDNVQKDLRDEFKVYDNLIKMKEAGIDKVILYDSGNLDSTLKDNLKERNKSEFNNFIDFQSRNKDLPYNELTQFNELMKYIRETYNPKWIGVLDKNEGWASELDKELLDKIYSPPDPTIFAYSLPVFFHWLSPDYYRSDGDWAENWEVRIFRNLDFFQDVYKKDDNKPYAEKSPLFSQSVTEPLNCRIRCYGYVTQEQRNYMYDWMIEHDNLKNVNVLPADNKQFLAEIEKTREEFYMIINQKDVALRPYRELNNIDGIITSHSKNDPSEELTVIGGLKSLWGICKKVYFQDNGCTDWSLQVAKAYGAEVITSPKEWFWPKGDECEGFLKDFSVWANSFRSFCKGQWIFRVSADEYAKSKRDQQLVVKFTNLPYNYIYVWINSLLHNDKKISQDRVCLYENREEFKYSRMVHETFHDALEVYHPRLAGFRPTHDQINWNHIGYLKKPEYLTKKFNVLYHRLNKMAYDRDKTDGMAAYNLGMEFVTDGDVQTAKKYMHEAIKRNERIIQPYFQLWAYAMQEAQGFAEKYVEHCKLPVDERRQFLQEFLNLAKKYQIDIIQHVQNGQQKNYIPLVTIK